LEADQVAHHEFEIEKADVNEQTVQGVRVLLRREGWELGKKRCDRPSSSAPLRAALTGFRTWNDALQHDLVE
jgi:hypothetical protein